MRPGISRERPDPATLVPVERHAATGAFAADRSNKNREEPREEPTRQNSQTSAVGPKGRGSLPLLAAGVAAVVLLGGGGYALTRGDADPPGVAGGTTSATAASTSAATGTASPSLTPTSAAVSSAPTPASLSLPRVSPCRHVPAAAPAAIIGRPVVERFDLKPGDLYPAGFGNPVPTSSFSCNFYADSFKKSGQTGSTTWSMSLPRSFSVAVIGQAITPEQFAKAAADIDPGCRAGTAPQLGAALTATQDCTEKGEHDTTVGWAMVSGLFGTTRLSCSVQGSPAGEVAGRLAALIEVCLTVRDGMAAG